MNVGFMEASHPEHRTDVEDELVQLARNIRGWQEGQTPKISDEQMLRRYPALGSTNQLTHASVGARAGRCCVATKYRSNPAPGATPAGGEAPAAIAPRVPSPL